MDNYKYKLQDTTTFSYLNDPPRQLQYVCMQTGRYKVNQQTLTWNGQPEEEKKIED